MNGEQIDNQIREQPWRQIKAKIKDSPAEQEAQKLTCQRLYHLMLWYPLNVVTAMAQQPLEEQAHAQND